MISLGFGVLFLLIGWIAWVRYKDLLDPSVAFSAAWGVVLIGVGLAEPFGYFQVSAAAGATFLFSGAAFLLGAAVVDVEEREWAESPVLSLDFRKLGWFCLLLHVAIVPVAIADIRSIVGGAEDIFQVAFQLRIRSVSGDDSVGALTGNYILSGLVFLPLLVVGAVTRRIAVTWVVLLSLPWVVLGLLIGGRGGLITVILSSVYVYNSFGGKVSVKAILLVALFVVLVLVAGNLLVSKIDAALEDGLSLVLIESAKGFFDYFFAGPILFSGWLGNPTLLTPTWDALIFPCHVLEKFGMCSVPTIHQEFLALNRDGDIGNVYSVVFSILPKYGYLGLAVLMFLYGWFAAYFHRTRNQSVFRLLIASLLFYATVLSIYLDAFAPSLYFFVKVYLICVAVNFAFKTSIPGGAYPRGIAT